MGHLLQPLPGAGTEQKGIERLRKLFSGAVVGERFLELLQRLHNGLRRLANQLELMAVLLRKFLHQPARMVGKAFFGQPELVVDAPEEAVVFQQRHLRLGKAHQRIFAQRQDVLGVEVGM